MNEISVSVPASCIGNWTDTGSASLAAIGIKLTELKLFEPIAQRVQIAQKTIKDKPNDKLYDALISMLTGAHGLVEINTASPYETG